MDTLIDLSTPARVPQAYSADFTPTLSRALAECFQRRRESLLPASMRLRNSSSTCVNSIKKRQEKTSIDEIDNSADLDDNWEPTLTNVMKYLPARQSEPLLDQDDLQLQINTPVAQLTTPEMWKDMVIETPEYTMAFGASPQRTHRNNQSGSPTKERIVPIQAVRTPKQQQWTHKRPQTTPLSPSFMTPINTKRQALQPVSSNTPNTPMVNSKLESQWTVDYSVYDLMDSPASHEIEICESPLKTPASVKKLRQLINQMPQRGGKQKRHPLRNELFSHYPSNFKESTYESETWEADTERTVSNLGNLRKPDLTNPSASKPRAAQVACRIVTPDPELQSWLKDKKLKDLEELIKFMELEKKFRV